MSERKELVEKLRALACDTLERPNPYDTAADLIERDGAELARLRERIAELERGEILTDKELMSAIITAVMSGVQSDRNDALRKVQRHIIRVEKERDDLETQCEHIADHRALAEWRVAELEAEVKRLIEQRDGPLYRCPQCDHLRLELGEAESLRAENERLKIEAARHETEMGEVIDERDEMESALSAAHVALGGDGEWACRVPSPPPPDSGNLSLDVPVLAAQVLARAEAAAREAVAAWMIEHAFATGHGDTLTDLLAELSWQIAEIKRDAIKWRDTPIPVPPGECPYPVHADHSIKACVDAGDCGCGQNKT